MVMMLMEEGAKAGIDLDDLENFAKQVTSWSQFRDALETFVEAQQMASHSGGTITDCGTDQPTA